MGPWDSYKQSRRTFIGQGSAAIGTAVVVEWVGSSALAADSPMANSQRAQALAPGPGWMDRPGHARQRYDGLMKVTGQKIYGRDFRARDMKDWPKSEIRVVILRVTQADRVLEGVDRVRLQKELRIRQVVTAEDLDQNRIKIPFYFGRIMMARVGLVPDYLGQPAALLYLSEEDAVALGPRFFDLSSYLKYGEKKARPEPTSYGSTRLTRYSQTPEKDLFSVVQDGSSSPPWEAPNPKGSTNARCVYYGNLIVDEVRTQGWLVVEGDFATQSIDPGFMESESGLAWFDRSKKTLHMTLGTQSPYDDADACATMFSDPACPLSVKNVKLNCCYPGGGFGGRDHSDFPLYLALGAVFAKGQPVRIVYNRFEQFQAGIKRHPAFIREKLAFDSQGNMKALLTDITLDGGGQNNFSFAVQAVAAYNASSAYYVPRLDIKSQALSSVGVTSGSMRGFGTLQAIFALESLVDEGALKLGIDAIDFRLKNLLTKHKNTTMGGRPTFDIQSEKILAKAKASPLWSQRERLRKERSNDRFLYGVGFALAVKSYGSNLDACLAAVEISPQGEILVKSNAVDMGNGIATTLPLAVADIFGRNADLFKAGVTEEFEALKLITSFEKDQKGETDKAKNPRWVPCLSMSQAASVGAYQMRHAVREAAQILLQYSLWPVALTLIPVMKDRLFRRDRVGWDGGNLVIDGQHRIAWETLVSRIYGQRLVTGAMVHTYYRAQWAQADFRIGPDPVTLPIDALALRTGSQRDYTLLDRERVQMPPFRNNRMGVDMFTPYGLLVAVQIERATGVVKLTEAHGFIDAGQMVQQDIVEGQAQGALAMGLGQTLFEDLPLTEGGPGQGGWNFGRYRVPTMRDMPLGGFTLHVIEPIAGDPPKGMAEVVECAVAPALANGIAHATGHRFRKLPITVEIIKGAIG